MAVSSGQETGTRTTTPPEEMGSVTGKGDGKEHSAISLRQASKVYRLSRQVKVVAARNLSLTVAAGEFIVITGRSGSGKTTLLNLAAGLAKPTSGEVFVENVNLWRLTDKQQSLLRNEKMGFVFQFPSLLPSLTVLENVILPTAFGPGEDKNELRRRATALLQDVGLADKLRAYPRQLSAGQQKRVVIARSLINQPEILLADEPTSDLDEQTEREFMSLLRAIHTERGITILLVTHNRDLVGYGTRPLEMAGGEIVA